MIGKVFAVDGVGPLVKRTFRCEMRVSTECAEQDEFEAAAAAEPAADLMARWLSLSRIPIERGGGHAGMHSVAGGMMRQRR